MTKRLCAAVGRLFGIVGRRTAARHRQSAVLVTAGSVVVARRQQRAMCCRPDRGERPGGRLAWAVWLLVVFSLLAAGCGANEDGEVASGEATNPGKETAPNALPTGSKTIPVPNQTSKSTGGTSDPKREQDPTDPSTWSRPALPGDADDLIRVNGIVPAGRPDLDLTLPTFNAGDSQAAIRGNDPTRAASESTSTTKATSTTTGKGRNTTTASTTRAETSVLVGRVWIKVSEGATVTVSGPTESQSVPVGGGNAFVDLLEPGAYKVSAFYQTRTTTIRGTLNVSASEPVWARLTSTSARSHRYIVRSPKAVELRIHIYDVEPASTCSSTGKCGKYHTTFAYSIPANTSRVVELAAGPYCAAIRGVPAAGFCESIG